MRTKSLDCGCCGQIFRTWEGYQDQDQDQGYGICQSCQNDITERDKKEFDKAISLIADNLSPERAKKFLAMDYERQKSLALDAINQGIIQFRIGG